MQPATDGKFCPACSLVVVDFTQMSTPEIQTFFQKNGTGTCGRFKTYQLEAKGSKLQRTLLRKQQQLDNRQGRFAKLLIGLLSLVLLVSGCRTRSGGAPAYGNAHQLHLPHKAIKSGDIKMTGILQDEQTDATLPSNTANL